MIQPKVYFAGPLFTHAERRWNEAVAAELGSRGFDVWLPQERGDARVRNDSASIPAGLFAAGIEGLDRADVVVAVLDGADPDSGTCFECGYAYAIGKPIVGLRTDFRAGGDDGEGAVNLMLTRSCRQIVTWPDGAHASTDVFHAAERVAAALRQAIAEAGLGHPVPRQDG